MIEVIECASFEYNFFGIILHVCYMEWFLVLMYMYINTQNHCTPGKISDLKFILTLSEPLKILLLLQVKQNYNYMYIYV